MTTTRHPNKTSRPSTPALRMVPEADPALVRLSRVRAVRKRIASGYYDREEVRDRLAVAVLGEIRRG